MSTAALDREARVDRRWIALAVIVTAQFMVVLDIAIVNVALPTIKTDLHFSQESLQWVVTAYSILFGGVLLLAHNWADWPATKKSYELMARYVHPHFQRNANELRQWSYDDAKAKYASAGDQSRAAVQAAIDKHQARKV